MFFLSILKFVCLLIDLCFWTRKSCPVFTVSLPQAELSLNHQSIQGMFSWIESYKVNLL